MPQLRQFLLLFVLATSLLAQQTITSATVSGRVEDPSGAVVVGSSISAQNTATHQSWNQTSNSEGRFIFHSLPPGQYQFRVTAAGFATGTQTLQLSASQSFELRFALPIATAETTAIICDFGPAIIETART